MRRRWSIEPVDSSVGEGYWAAYSDLMAGILLVFAVAAAASWMLFIDIVVEPTEVLKQWESVLNAICHDEEMLKDPRVRVNCDTGSIIITESSLRYPKGETELSDEGKKVLDHVVPRYLRVVTQQLSSKFSIEGIEVSGHTDSTGDYGTNSWVSRERAGRVLLYLLDSPSMAEYRGFLREKGYAVGFADSRPPDGGGGDIDRPEARRIEIQVHVDKSAILKDIRVIMEKLLNSMKESVVESQ